MVLPIAQTTMAYTAGHTVMMSGVHLGLVGALRGHPDYPACKVESVQLGVSLGCAFTVWLNTFNFLTTSGHSIYYQANLMGLLGICQLGVFVLDSYVASKAKRAPAWMTVLKKNITMTVVVCVLGTLWATQAKTS
jgi:hypothetical protein